MTWKNPKKWPKFRTTRPSVLGQKPSQLEALNWADWPRWDHRSCCSI